jgi:hypothetical protein
LVETLRRLISQLDTPDNASSSFAHIGNLATTLNASATHSNYPRVIDSGAFVHMTGMSPLFSSYNPCSGREKVRMAIGSLLLVLGKGSASITPSMTLSSALHVLDFANNFLSIAHFTLELNCQVIFYSHYSFFPDLVTRRSIGSGSLRDGLYYLDS